MNDQPNLSVDEIKALLTASSKAKNLKHVQLQKRFSEALGTTPQEQTPEIIAIENKVNEHLIDLIAQRLKRGQRDVPLISKNDINSFIPTIIEIITEGEADELDAEGKKAIEKAIHVIFENMVSMIDDSSLGNSHENHWKMIRTALDLAQEKGVTPPEVFSLEGTTDEIYRRLYTQKEYLAIQKKGANHFFNADSLKNKIILPLFEAFVVDEDDQEILEELKQTLEDELMPQLQEQCAKLEEVSDTYFNEEAVRIWS